MDQRTSHAAIASGDTMRLWCRCGQVEMEVRGAPIISAECLCASCRTAAEMMVTSVSSYEPNPVNHEVYRKAYDVYRLSRDAIRPAWAAMREMRALSGAEEAAE